MQAREVARARGQHDSPSRGLRNIYKELGSTFGRLVTTSPTACAARVVGVDVTGRRNEIPGDYLSRMKMAYLDEGPSPSHRWYGWVRV